MQIDTLKARWTTNEKQEFLAWLRAHRIIMTDLAKAEAAIMEGNASLDLRGINFSGFELLENFLFFDADLRWADFSNAKLRGSFQGARLEEANFSKAFILSGYFNGAVLTNASFKNVRCESADLAEADCRGVDFTDSAFDRVDFYGADLRGANFANAKFAWMKLHKAKIDECQRNSTWLTEADHLLGVDQIDWQKS